MDQANEDLKERGFQVQRKIVPHEEGGNPELEPLFANHFEVMRMGTDYFIDVGIVAPLEMLSVLEQVKSGGDIPRSVNFYVLQRVAMSFGTLKVLRDKLNQLCLDVEKEGGPLASSQPTNKTSEQST